MMEIDCFIYFFIEGKLHCMLLRATDIAITSLQLSLQALLSFLANISLQNNTSTQVKHTWK